MHLPPPSASRACLFATALAAFYILALMVALVCFLQDAALAAVPVGGHTAALGTDYVWANRLAVLFLILFCALLAHAVARLVQLVSIKRV